MTAFHSARYTLFTIPASPGDEVVGFAGSKQAGKTLPVEEIAVEFVYPRQQEMKTFSSERR